MSKILLSLPDDLLAKLDEYCKRYSFERSELIRTLIRNKVWEHFYSIDKLAHKLQEDTPQPKNIIQKIKKDPEPDIVKLVQPEMDKSLKKLQKEVLKEVDKMFPLPKQCKICGFGLDMYGECLNKQRHKKGK